MDADADNVAVLNPQRVALLEGFVDEDWIAEALRGRCGHHVEPSWRDNGRAKRAVTRVDEVNSRPLRCGSYGGLLNLNLCPRVDLGKNYDDPTHSG